MLSKPSSPFPPNGTIREHWMYMSLLLPTGTARKTGCTASHWLLQGQHGALAAQMLNASHRASREYLHHRSSLLCIEEELSAQASSRCESQEIITAHMDAQFSSLQQRGLLIHGKYVAVMSHQVTFLRFEHKIWGRGCLVLKRVSCILDCPQTLSVGR